jgi:hypothetical protein
VTDAEGDVAGGGDDGATVPSRARTALLVVGLVTVAAGIPLAVALGVLRSPRWYPLLDLAQTELRVRDVGTADSPLVGLAGRITGDDGLQGSHPGPLSFWALAPFYTLLGRTAWALQGAAVALNLLALGTATWIAHRRGGRYAAVGTAVALAVLMHAYGRWLTEAWNPYMPMLWWVVFLLAVWSVLCGDLPVLPVAVFAGSFCAQTHIPYAGLIFGMGGLLTLVLAYRFWAGRRAPAAPADPAEPAPMRSRRAHGRGRRARDARVHGGGRRARDTLLASAGLLVVLWLPPVIDQVTNERGNLQLIYESFTREGTEEAGFRSAAEVLTVNLSVENLWQDHGDDSQAAVDGGLGNPPALLLLATMAATAVLAWRRGYRDLLQLHAVLGAALVLGLVAVSRIFDTMWYYLVLWAWGVMVLALLASVWTVVRTAGDLLAARDDDPARLGRFHRIGAIALVVALAAIAGKFTYDAAFYEPPAFEETEILAVVVPDLVDGLRSGDLPGGGEDGRYLVRWRADALAIGSQGFGLLLELERRGFDVGVMEGMSTGAVAHRVRPEAEATAGIEYVVGEQHIERWRDLPGSVEAVYYEPRDGAERERFDELHAAAVSRLEEEGLDHLVTLLDENLFRTGIHPDTPPDVSGMVTRMMDLGLPVAIFVAPPSAA